MKFKDNLFRIYFAGSALLLSFVVGFGLAWLGRFPTRLVDAWSSEFQDWRTFPLHHLRRRPEKFLQSDDVLPEAVASRTNASHGQTFLTGFFGDRPGLRLVDETGQTLHEWHVSFPDVWPEATHVERVPRHHWETHLHGAALYPNGDVVFNFEYGGLVRMDRCSNVLWKLPRLTHHSIEIDDAGNFWVPDRKMRTKPSPELPNIPAPVWDEYLIKVSPSGEVLQEISLLEVFFKSGQEALLFANGSHGLGIKLPGDKDFSHLNDVEALPAALAPAFPMFVPGDLLVSLRNLNLVMVVSPKTETIKWSMVGPYLRQHDPDFLPNGRIGVFDNRLDSKGGRVRGGSRILEIDPSTRKVDELYGSTEDHFWYSGRMGAYQQLPTGNHLVTATEMGYVFEVTPKGEVMWSYVNRFDDATVAWIEGAIRYPAGYMRVSGQQECAGK